MPSPLEDALKGAKNNAQGSAQEDAPDRVSLHTITLVFTDDTTSDYQVISMGLGSVYEETEKHFLVVLHLDDVELSHQRITSHEGVVIAQWEGVPANSS